MVFVTPSSWPWSDILSCRYICKTRARVSVRLKSSGTSRCVEREGSEVSKDCLESEGKVGNYSHSDIV